MVVSALRCGDGQSILDASHIHPRSHQTKPNPSPLPNPKQFRHPPLDTGNNGVGVRTLLGSLVALLDDNDLLACLATVKDDGDLSWLLGQYSLPLSPRNTRLDDLNHLEIVSDSSVAKDKKFRCTHFCRVCFGSDKSSSKSSKLLVTRQAAASPGKGGPQVAMGGREHFGILDVRWEISPRVGGVAAITAMRSSRGIYAYKREKECALTRIF